MALKNFTWFDKPGKAQYDPSSLENYVAGGQMTPSGYSPRQQGFLSLFGTALSGGVAPFVGDTDWLQRQQKMQLEQQQSDMEFKLALDKLAENQQELQLKRQERLDTRDYQNRYLDVLAKQASGQSIANQEQRPLTLADAIPLPEEKLITKRGMSSSGKPFTSQTVDPQYQKDLELRNFYIKEASEIAPNIEKYLEGSNSLREAIKGIPDTKPGFGSKYVAQGKSMVGEMSNAKWYTDYNVAFEQQYLPILRALESSKVVSDKETANIIASMGDKSIPNEAKIKALDMIDSKIATGAATKFKSFGIDEDVYSQLFPKTADFLFGSKKSNNQSTGGNESGDIQSQARALLEQRRNKR